MKKSVIYTGILSLFISGVVFAQTTTSSTNPNEAAGNTVKRNTTTGVKRTLDGANHQNNGTGNTASQKGRATNAGGNTNDDGKVSKGGVVGGANASQSSPAQSGAVRSQSGQAGTASAVATPAGKAPQPATKPKTQTVNRSQGAINKTQPGTEVKKGSGSSKKNMKNKTGKTGNYQNQETKNTNGDQ